MQFWVLMSIVYFNEVSCPQIFLGITVPFYTTLKGLSISIKSRVDLHVYDGQKFFTIILYLTIMTLGPFVSAMRPLTHFFP